MADPSEWKVRVGDPIKARRMELGLSIRQAATQSGFSEGLWRQLESGVRIVTKGLTEPISPKATTTHAACRTLGWSRDSIDRLRAGKPVRKDPAGPSPIVAASKGVHVATVVEQLVAEVGRLREDVSASQSEVALLRAELQRQRAR